MISRFLQHVGLKKEPPWSYLQVIRERMELNEKVNEEGLTADILGSYHKENFKEAAEWMDEVERFLNETMELEKLPYQSLWTDSWCNDMISKIRKLRARHYEPNYPFLKGRDVLGLGLSLSLHEEFYCEVRSLGSIEYLNLMIARLNGTHHSETHKINEDKQKQRRVPAEAWGFLQKIKRQLQEKIPETNSGWYHDKIAEARTFIAKYDPPFLLQSDEDVVGSSKMPLLVAAHAELCSEIRKLISLKYPDLILVYNHWNTAPDLEPKFKKKLQEQIKEVNKFLIEINLQLEEKIPEKDSDWYHNKIAETRMFIVTNYPAFPFPSQYVESTALVDNEGAENIVYSPQSENVKSASSINMPKVVESKESVHDVGYSKEQYQIFLSFRGEDTRHNFTSFLYHALLEKGFKIFMDEEKLQIGDSISNVITAAIENSKLSIIIFSQNFADSTWCLDELVKILECREKKNQLIWPIFYKVDPSDVRHQRNSYKKAMIKQKTKFNKDPEKVNIWRSALTQICDLKAFHYKENSGSERDFIQAVLFHISGIRASGSMDIILCGIAKVLKKCDIVR